MTRVSRYAALLLLSLGVLCRSASSLSAQATPASADGTRVERVRFEGVRQVSRSALGRALYTQPTRCRSFVYFPFCQLTDASAFVDKQYLNVDELERDRLRVQLFYWMRGFRDTDVEVAVTPRGDGVQVAFAIEEGPPTLIDAVEVRQTVTVLSPRDIDEARVPRRGARLNAFAVDSARIALLDRLWELGYADASVRDTAWQREGAGMTLQLVVEPGARATIGQIEVRGNERISDRTIRRLLDLQPGAVFRRDDLNAALRTLFGSELFRQAIVSSPAVPDTTKPVVVTVQEAPPREVELGVGFNTVEFAQLQAQFTRYNFLGGARRLDLRGAIGNLLAPQLHDRTIFGTAVPAGISEVEDVFLQPTWQLSADFQQPFFLNTRHSLGLGVFGRRRTVPGIVVDRGIGANASLTRRFAQGFTTSATYRFESNTVEAGDVYYCINFGVCRPNTIDALRGSHHLSPLGLTSIIDRMNDPLSPTDGYTGRLDIEHASQISLSDFRYTRASGEATRYLRLGPGVLAGRVRAGRVWPRGSTAEALGLRGVTETVLHPRTRFYAGGARSVRGYGENQLGPRILTIHAGMLEDAGCTAASIASATCDPNGVESSEFQSRPLGGNEVVEASIEYRVRLWGPITGAVFLDGAAVGDRNLNIPTGGRSAITPGFGVRYISPIGPVRVDLGIRPTLVEELPVVTSIEDEEGRSQLVQLERTKRYDPLEGSSGTLGQILSRLQIHLSIGEAF